MQLLINGDTQEVRDGSTLGELLAQLDLGQTKVAVEVNQQIVPRSSHETHVLQQGDRIEIIHAIGGG